MSTTTPITTEKVTNIKTSSGTTITTVKKTGNGNGNSDNRNNDNNNGNDNGNENDDYDGYGYYNNEENGNENIFFNYILCAMREKED